MKNYKKITAFFLSAALLMTSASAFDFDTEVIETSPTGPTNGQLVKNAVYDAIDRDKQYNKVSMNDGMKNETFLSLYNGSKEIIAQRVADIFPKESGWWNEYISLPIYFNVLNGYEDGTLKPSRDVTGAEICKIVTASLEADVKNDGILANPDFDGQWYNNYYNKIAKAFTYENSYGITKTYMNSPMKRCEVAYVLARVADDGTLNSYIAKAQSGDISQMASFSDFTNVVYTDGTLQNEQNAIANGQIPARFAGAMMFLNAKGVMVGNGNGTISPLNNITRAEVFKLIQETCKITPSYTVNKFSGWETRTVSSNPTPSQNVYTMDTVLNPNAPAEYQYKVSDINTKSYVYILQGKKNFAEYQLREEYSKKIVTMVQQSVVFNEDSTTLNLIDIGSDYHEVHIEAYDENLKIYNYYSSQQSGQITIPCKPVGISITVEGRQDKTKTPGGWSYGVRRSVTTENGGWDAGWVEM